MPLTLNQFLLLVITLAAVIAVTYLIILFHQLKKTAKEGEKTLIEVRDLVAQLKTTSQKADKKIDDLDEVLKNVKKTAAGFSEVAVFLSAKLIKPSSKYWPFLYPMIRMIWRQLKKKKKEDKHGK